MADADSSSTAAQVAKVFLDSTLQFYDKAPIIASIGYLFIASALPLFLLLRFAARMKQLDNQKVIALFEREISKTSASKESGQQAGVTATPPQA